MLKIQRILCPVDFSEFSARAYDYALSLARHYEAKLYLEHVVELASATYARYPAASAVDAIFQDLEKDAQKRLEDLVKTHAQDRFRPEVVVHKGFVPSSVLAFAESLPADLIVMGTQGYRGLDRLVLGSVAEKVLRKARCPVLVVRKPAHDFVSPSKGANGTDPVQLHRILLCTDFSTAADRALSYAFSLAMEYQAELTLVHVLENHVTPAEADASSAAIIRRLEMLIPPDAKNWCTTKAVMRIGKPYEQIIQLGSETKADLVVLGVRGRNALDLALFGSTTHRVIQLGPCPVLVVHT